MSCVSFSRELWPLVLVRFPSERLADDAVETYLDELGANFTQGSRYAIVTDASGAPGARPLSVQQRARINRWLGDHRDLILRWSVGNAVVITQSPLIRGLMAAFHRHYHHYPRNLHNVVGSFVDGVDWALERLVAESVLPASEVAARRRAALSWKTPADPVAEPLAATPPPPADLYEPLVEMFDEPVFLVTPAGELVHANKAATARYPEPPAWLPQTVALSDPGGEGPPPCRVTDIEPGEGDLLYLVIPEQTPSSGPDPLVEELPPSLRKVAQLLAEGLSDKEIAAACELSFSTIRTYVTRIFKRMGVHSRAELAARWRDQ